MITGASYSLHELHEVPFPSLTVTVILRIYAYMTKQITCYSGSYNKSQQDAIFLKFVFLKLENQFISLAFIIRIYQDSRSSECQNVMQAYVFSKYSKRATVLSFPSSLIW